MSINNFLDIVPFSVSGLQDANLTSINGNPILSTITIAGQTAYLSYSNSVLTLLIPNATGATTGLLTNTDWNTFNNKITTINVAGQTAYLSYNSLTETLTLSIPNATNSITGLLTSTDWNTFNNKLSTINVAGQTAFLSYNSLTETLTLSIPNANASTTGLLTSTDWNTFNSKENTLTFISPLNRVGNNIGFNYGVNNVWTGTQTIQNDIFFQSGFYYYTGLPNATTPNALYVDAITGRLSYGSPSSILGTNNSFTGTNDFNATTSFYSYANFYSDTSYLGSNYFIGQNFLQGDTQLAVTNIKNSFSIVGDILKMYKDTGSSGEFLYFNSSGNMGYYTPSAGVNWYLNANGDAGFKSTSVNGILSINNSWLNINNSEIAMNDHPIRFRGISDPFHRISYQSFPIDGVSIQGFGGVCLGATGNSYPTYTFRPLLTSTSSTPLKAWANYDVNTNTYLEYTNANDLNGVYQGNIKWYLSSLGILVCDRINTTGALGIRGEQHFTQFIKNLAVNNWITDCHGNDFKSKVVLGNLGDAIGGDMPTLGGHNSPLTGWTDMWINPYTTTHFGNVIVWGAFSNPSDRRIKTDISYLDSGKSIQFIKALKPCIFRRCDKIDDPYIKNEEQPKRRLEHGFIAQDIEEVAQTEAQKLIINIEQYRGEERKTITLLSLIPEIVQANKDMINKIELLEEENKVLREEMNKIKLYLGIN